MASAARPGRDEGGLPLHSIREDHTMQTQLAVSAAFAGLLAASAGHADPVRLSHSVEEFLVTGGTAIACVSTAAPQTSSDNQFWRSFTLADFGVSDSVTIDSIEFGVETL